MRPLFGSGTDSRAAQVKLNLWYNVQTCVAGVSVIDDSAKGDLTQFW